jgi:hypothetical protein
MGWVRSNLCSWDGTEHCIGRTPPAAARQAYFGWLVPAIGATLTTSTVILTGDENNAYKDL